jgi:metal-responsive CopG/Arc/MetJ family transcriptional regulator
LLVFANNGVMERKTKERKEEYANFSIRLPVKLVEAVEAVAAKENRTRNNMIEQLLWYAVNAASDTHDPSSV